MRPFMYKHTVVVGTGCGNSMLKCQWGMDSTVEGVAHGTDCVIVIVQGIVPTVWMGWPNVGVFLKVPSVIAKA